MKFVRLFIASIGSILAMTGALVNEQFSSINSNDLPVLTSNDSLNQSDIDNSTNSEVNEEDLLLDNSDDLVVSESSVISNTTNSSKDKSSKVSNETNEKSKNDKVSESLSTPSTGRIEVSSLNIKSDLSSNQILYTNQMLNGLGNTVLYFEDSSFSKLNVDSVIYIRSSLGDKVNYKVFNTFESTLSDNSFYSMDTTNRYLTLVVKIDSSKVRVFQAVEQ